MLFRLTNTANINAGQKNKHIASVKCYGELSVSKQIDQYHQQGPLPWELVTVFINNITGAGRMPLLWAITWWSFAPGLWHSYICTILMINYISQKCFQCKFTLHDWILGTSAVLRSEAHRMIFLWLVLKSSYAQTSLHLTRATHGYQLLNAFVS